MQCEWTQIHVSINYPVTRGLLTCVVINCLSHLVSHSLLPLQLAPPPASAWPSLLCVWLFTCLSSFSSFLNDSSRPLSPTYLKDLCLSPDSSLSGKPLLQENSAHSSSLTLNPSYLPPPTPSLPSYSCPEKGHPPVQSQLFYLCH